jgi:rubrerythrin
MEMSTDKYLHHRTILPNGQRLKEVGLEAWLEEQKQRWSCQQCGLTYTWFESKCRSCGSDLFSVQVEFGQESSR